MRSGSTRRPVSEKVWRTAALRRPSSMFFGPCGMRQVLWPWDSSLVMSASVAVACCVEGSRVRRTVFVVGSMARQAQLMTKEGEGRKEGLEEPEDERLSIACCFLRSVGVRNVNVDETMNV